ncbi:MAG: hypothetical protein P8Y94_04780, partial [Acidobacteriota bacterium]
MEESVYEPPKTVAVFWNDMRSSLSTDKDRLVEFFLDNYVGFFRRKRAADFYFFSKDTLSFLFDLPNVLLVGAPNSTNVKAVSVFTYTPYAGEYLCNISLPEGRDHAAALLWYAVEHLKSMRIPILNLGGSSAEFKRRFGARQMPLRCLKQVYDPSVYGGLCLRAKVDPDDRQGYFPPYDCV